jgi:hypothetical protein
VPRTVHVRISPDPFASARRRPGTRERSARLAARTSWACTPTTARAAAAASPITALGGLILRCLPEPGEHDAFRLAGAAVMITGALWPHSQPSVAMLAAYAADPALAAMRLDFTDTIREVLAVMAAGLLARRP